MLGICCPPEARKAKAVSFYVSAGLAPLDAEIAADGLLAHVDRLLALSPSAIMKHAKEHKG